MSEQPADNSLEPSPRIQLVDALRGFALFGILVVNIAYFATAYGPDSGLPNLQSQSWLDDAASWLTAILFETKFYLLFSLLFGYSFVLQMEAAERQGARFTRRMYRRLLGLFIIGSLHIVFFFYGDILTVYALIGVILLWCRNIRARTALITAAIILGFMFVIAVMVWLAFELTGDQETLALDRNEEKANAIEATVNMRGSFGDAMGQRLHEFATYGPFVYTVQGPIVLAMFFIGFAAAKTRVFEQVDRYRNGFKKFLVIGLPIGLLGGIALAWTELEAGIEDPLIFAGVAITTITAPLLMGSYVAMFALSSARSAGRKVIDVLAPMGQMALSNYILQSVLMGLVFYGYGLRQFGELGPFEVFMVGVAIYVLLLAFSHLWMMRHTHGPLEWLLRAFTNWEIPTWRVPVGTLDR